MKRHSSKHSVGTATSIQNIGPYRALAHLAKTKPDRITHHNQKPILGYSAYERVGDFVVGTNNRQSKSRVPILEVRAMLDNPNLHPVQRLLIAGWTPQQIEELYSKQHVSD